MKTVITRMLAGLLVTATSAWAADVVVYRTPSCGCCLRWVAHLQSNGFTVEIRNLENLSPIKRQHGVSAELEACHTALVQGYVIEGHVPADDIKRLLRERPTVTGLAVPDMPVGSPGMEGPNPEPYEVLTFDRNGRTTVYSNHDPR